MWNRSTKMCDKLKILIVEDEATVADLLARLIQPFLDKFPGSSVTIVKRLCDCLDIINATPPTDIAFLDLNLLDSGMENTMKHIDEIQSKCPLAIVTGSSPETVKSLLEGREVEIAEKPGAFKVKGFFTEMLVRTIASWHEKRYEKIQENINRMRTFQDTHA